MLDTATAKDTEVPATANPMIRQVEAEFPGIFIMTPRRPKDSPNQQFGVWRAEAVHVGDLVASGLVFSLEELRTRVMWLLMPKAH